MNVKHGTQVRLTVTAGDEVLQQSEMDVTSLGGALTVCGIMYNRLAVSGGVSWWNPGTGYAIPKPKWTVELVDPTDELADGQLCDCADCLSEEAVV
jgi:hypothetical protein